MQTKRVDYDIFMLSSPIFADLKGVKFRTYSPQTARLAELHGGQAVTLVGSGAPLLADTLAGARVLTPVSPDPVAIARLAAARSAPSHSPRPLYLRAPYATLPTAAAGT